MTRRRPAYIPIQPGKFPRRYYAVVSDVRDDAAGLLLKPQREFFSYSVCAPLFQRQETVAF